jgi:cell division protein FtsW
MLMISPLKSNLRYLIAICTILVAIGLIFIYSASSIYAQERFHSQYYFIKKQLYGLVIGFFFLSIIQLIPISWIKKGSSLFFLLTLILTAATLFPSLSRCIHGSTRWLNMGFFSFQPSELLKCAFLLYASFFLSKRNKKAPSWMHTYMPFFAVIGIMGLILLSQPDFGLTITLIVTALLLLCVGQFHQRYIIRTIFILLPLIVTLVTLRPYRIKRILTFLNPWNDPQGAGFQIIQSLIAIGSGGFWGTGISHSKQKFFYLPMQHTDFIFSIIAEETGFIGSLFLINLFVFFAYFGMKLAQQMNDLFCLFFTAGFVIITTLQAIINLGVTVGLVPTKGIGLPFVSYGNSSLICNMIMLGLIINMTNSTKLKSKLF